MITQNTIDETCNQVGSFKFNGNKKDIYCWYLKEAVISWSDNEARELRKYDTHRIFRIQEGIVEKPT